MNIDFNNLDFSYKELPKRFRAYYKDQKWYKSQLEDSPYIRVHEGATSLHYAQECFEGLKAYKTKRDEIQLFRPLENAARLRQSAKYLLMPEISDELFLEGVKKTVEANREFVPPYGNNASLYIRPFLFGNGPNLGVSSAPEFIFSVFASPVGPYYKGGLQTSKFYITNEFDRAAPFGTGNIKIGGNYAASLYISNKKKKEGYTEVLYLDPKEHKYIEEFGGANFFGITSDGKFYTPKSDSILPSITKKSILQIAKDIGMEVFETQIPVDNLNDFSECGAMGTAALIAPANQFDFQDKKYTFNNEVGPWTKKLYNKLLGIQFGDEEDIHNWVYKL